MVFIYSLVRNIEFMMSGKIESTVAVKVVYLGRIGIVRSIVLYVDRKCGLE